ncbi:MAG: NADP-dependent glyceraldehyde-3-phosphate dehydrogenase [Deltaproteobacteria bacterium]|nr:NADP-dependent glyceraldehyde-3-phosphate dehydrogenase [Deltaproteobacteria bacterium]
MTTAAIRFPTADEVPESARVDASRWANRYLIGGEVREWSGESAEVRSPICHPAADGTLARAMVGRAPMLDADEANRALAAAKAAWNHGRGEWPNARPARRIGCLERFVEGMLRVREDVVRLLMWEIGKTRKDSESEFDRTVVYVRDTIDALKEQDRSAGRFVMEEGTIGQIRRSPLGVVLCMGPFNYPLNETFTTLIPAVLMGNTVVSKLPKYGALLHLPLLDAMREAFPAGVVNIVQGDGPKVIGPIMQSGDVDVLAFIGTSRVANILKKQHPRPNRLRCITGLEAKNPAIVLPDANLDVAVAECVSGALSYNGQRCTAIKLVLVHESIAGKFVSRLCDAVDALPAGMPWDPGVKLTPLVEDDKPKWMASMVEDAVNKGAMVVNTLGGKTVGTFYRPAVVYPVKPDMQLYSQEQFGPIVPVATFREDAEIDAFMRSSPYGQQVALFGSDSRRLAGLIDALVNQVSRINVNTQCRRGPDTFPFTGRKDSAEGTLSVSDALRAFSIRATVATASNEENKRIMTEIVTGRLSSFLTTDFVF